VDPPEDPQGTLHGTDREPHSADLHGTPSRGPSPVSPLHGNTCRGTRQVKPQGTLQGPPLGESFHGTPSGRPPRGDPPGDPLQIDPRNDSQCQHPRGASTGHPLQGKSRGPVKGTPVPEPPPGVHKQWIHTEASYRGHPPPYSLQRTTSSLLSLEEALRGPSPGNPRQWTLPGDAINWTSARGPLGRTPSIILPQKAVSRDITQGTPPKGHLSWYPVKGTPT
jgi:hypothetical protein